MKRRPPVGATLGALPGPYRRLLEQSRAPACTTDLAGAVTAANSVLLEILGADLDQVVGAPLTEFLRCPQEDGPLRRHLAEAAQGQAASAELDIAWPDGERRSFRLISIPVFDAGAVVGSATFFRESRGGERDETLQRAVYEIAHSASTVDSLDALYPAIHRSVGRLTRARNFFIALYDPASDMVEFPYFVDEFDPPPPPVPLSQGLTAWVVRNRRPLLVNRDDFPTLLAGGDVTLKGARPDCWLGVPLMAHQEVIGVIAMQDYSHGARYGQRDLQMLEFVSSQIALVIQRRRAEQAIRESERRFREVLENVRMLAFTCDAGGVILYCNGFAGELTGYAREYLVGRRFYDVLVAPDQVAEARLWFRRAMRSGKHPPYRQFALRSREGKLKVIGWNATTVRGGAARCEGLTAIGMDLTESHAAQEALSYQARHDALTGLVNRREFEQRLEELRSGGGPHALLYIDLDQFKVINDACGHFAGDELLKELSARMEARVRATDTLARIGGDEFGVLLAGCPLGKAEQIARSLLHVIRNTPFRWEGKVFALGASIGVVEIHGDSVSASELMQGADTACYLAKEQGRNRVCTYRAGEEEIAIRREQMDWVGRLTEALTGDRLRLYHQRLMEIDHGRPGRTIGSEVLLRLLEPDGTVVSAGVFVPAAERYGLMPQIDRWVVSQTLARMARIRADEIPVLGVNLSATSINDADFCAWLVAELQRHGGAAERLVFEVTETAAIANLARSNELISELTRLGCRFALDDFGSGFASFSYLKGLAVRYVKIDGSFVAGVGRDPVDTAMVESIARMAHLLQGRTVAESVEDLALLPQLESLGVDFVQGFAIHVPEPLPGD